MKDDVKPYIEHIQRLQKALEIASFDVTHGGCSHCPLMVLSTKDACHLNGSCVEAVRSYYLRKI